MSWEGKILTAGISLRATQASVSNSPEEKLESIVKFGESIYSECKSGKLGLLQQYVGGDLAIKTITSDSVDKLIAEFLVRVSKLEDEYESINEFRQHTNRSLDVLRSHIRNLSYGEL